MKLAVGPLLYFWDRDRVQDFYARIAAAPVEIVYLGETVCAKRRALRLDDWLAIAQQLAQAGKQVVLSTLALVEAESELSTLGRICNNGRFPVEANDMGAVNLLAGRAGFVAGPHINTYNAETLKLLAAAGASRWVMPVELDRDTLAALQADRPAGLETEVFAFGRLPLSFSARCFTARAHNLPKDDCQFRCRDYPDGLPLKTQDGQPFLTLNGIQVQSAGTCNLLGQVGELAALGVDVLRLSPQAEGMEAVIGAFREVMDGRLPPPAGLARLAPHLVAGPCNGYWHGGPGMAWTGP